MGNFSSTQNFSGGKNGITRMMKSWCRFYSFTIKEEVDITM